MFLVRDDPLICEKISLCTYFAILLYLTAYFSSVEPSSFKHTLSITSPQVENGIAQETSLLSRAYNQAKRAISWEGRREGKKGKKKKNEKVLDCFL